MKRLKIAVQKSGRLKDGSIKLLKECGISISNGGGQLKAVADNFPLEILYLRNSDIPQYIEDGVADVGIIGENVLVEKQKNIRVVEKLGFSKCRLSMAVPRETNYSGVDFFDGKKLATSYPNTLRQFLAENELSANIHEINGSVEIAPGIGLADGVCDLVSTGSTLLTNGLKEVEVVLQSEAVLTASPQLTSEATKLLDRMLFRIQAVLNSRNNKYVLLNAPNNKIDDICKVLPGMNSPTILPLQKEGWSSLHSVINENRFWEVIDELRAFGAEGILVVPIEKMVV
jgi:ATP phosphoribosyltransferase